MKKVLVTGASGLLGRAIYKEMRKDPSCHVLGLAFSRVTKELTKLDLTNATEVTSTIQQYKPDVIIHSAAERRPNVVELKEDQTKALNVDATSLLAKEAEKIGCWVLYISTDYVFDGESPPYGVNDKPNPLNKYGKSKLDGEEAVLSVNPSNAVLRVPILYGEIEYLGESAVTVLYEKVKDISNTCVMSDYEIRYPTHCDDVAAACKLLIDNRMKDASLGEIFHFSGNEAMTKYNMALSMADVFKLPTNHIKGDKAPMSEAPRPFNSHLDCSRINAMGLAAQKTFKDNIKLCLENYN